MGSVPSSNTSPEPSLVPSAAPLHASQRKDEAFLSPGQVLRILSLRLVSIAVSLASFFSLEAASDRQTIRRDRRLPLYILTRVCETSMLPSHPNNYAPDSSAIISGTACSGSVYQTALLAGLISHGVNVKAVLLGTFQFCFATSFIEAL